MYDVSVFLDTHSNGQRARLSDTIHRYLAIEAAMDELGFGNTDPETGKSAKDLQSDAHTVVQDLLTVFGFTPDDIDVIYDNAEDFRELCSPIPSTGDLEKTA